MLIEYNNGIVKEKIIIFKEKKMIIIKTIKFI